MKKSKVEFIMLLLAMLIICSCEYEPTEIYNRLVNKNVTPPQIQTVELTLDEDTVFLHGYKSFNFKFKSSNQKIQIIRYSIDGVLKNYVNSDSGVFNINEDHLTEGSHTLRLEVFTGSGSGSIADHIGAEGFQFTKSWVLIVVYSSITIANTTITNGFLQISWAKYTASDFKEYIIYKSTWNSLKTEFKRVKTPEFIDSSYVGEGRSYTIEVSTLNGKILQWSRAEVKQDLPKLSFRATDQNENLVSWGKTKYYNAVDTFLLVQSLFSSAYDPIQATQDANDTIYNNVHVKFGDQANLKLRLVPKNYNKLFHFPNDIIETPFITFYTGFPFMTINSNISDIHQVSSSEFIYVYKYDSLVKYSVSKKQVTQKIGYKIAGCNTSEFGGIYVSPTGKYIAFIIGCNYNIAFSTTANLQSYVFKSLPPPTGSSIGPVIPLSENGTCIVNDMQYGFFLYDLINTNTIAKCTKNRNAQKISQNGDYFIVSDDSTRLMHYQNSQFSTVWKQSLTSPSKLLEFDGSDPDRLAFWDGSTFSIKRCSDFFSVYKYALTDNLICNIDYYAQEMLTYNGGHLYVRNLTDGSVKNDIPINFKPSDYWSVCYLINHTIVCRTGLMYFVL